MKKVFTHKYFLIGIYILFAWVAGTQSLLSGKKTFGEDPNAYTAYNNYTIFKHSFYHLTQNQDLYQAYPDEHWDLFKYTPTFAAFFGVFAIFPDWLGLNLWNLLNALVLLFAVYSLPRLNPEQKALALWIVLIELMTSMQNEQSNGLMAGLLIASFAALENRKYWIATACVVFAVFIKLFGIMGFALFLFYPRKIRLAGYSLVWTGLLLLLPLVFIGMDQYLSLFESYGRLLSQDHSLSLGYSVMGWLNSWFGAHFNKNAVLIAGLSLFLLPLIKHSQYNQFNFRILVLASMLIWIVIFNHKAESPTFIIAMSGVAIWFVISKKNLLNISLFITAFVLTSLSPTDIFPRFIREEYVIPYTLKALPCILIWIKVLWQLMHMRLEKTLPLNADLAIKDL